MSESEDKIFHGCLFFNFTEYEIFNATKVEIKYKTSKPIEEKVLHLLHFLRQTFVFSPVKMHYFCKMKPSCQKHNKGNARMRMSVNHQTEQRAPHHRTRRVRLIVPDGYGTSNPTGAI